MWGVLLMYAYPHFNNCNFICINVSLKAARFYSSNHASESLDKNHYFGNYESRSDFFRVSVTAFECTPSLVNLS